jgi:hypothetical protein
MAEHAPPDEPFTISLQRFLRGRASDRKARLYACACCRMLWAAERDERIDRAVDVAERHADGLADAAEVQEARKEANDASRQDRVRRDLVYRICGSLAISEGIRRAAECCAQFAPQAMPCGPEEAARRIHAVLRDVFGNPFCHVAIHPSWLTSDVLALATGLYYDRAFDRMPILADALQDAGCDNEYILGHCRGAGPHVRGCWVVDAVLGKA